MANLRLSLASALLTLAEHLAGAPAPTHPHRPPHRYTTTGAPAPEAARVGVVVSVWA